jgi:cyclophilin family peptidyl-prolyl cis-trans isomerase
MAMPDMIGSVGRTVAWITALALGVLALGSGGCASTPREDPDAPLVWVELTTTMGPIVVELDRARAPVSVANFLSYVDDGSYEGTIFHRVMKDFVIQGGGHTPDLAELPGREPIVNEWMNGLKNTRGTIAMAREADPDTATRQWYINVADNPRLDEPRPVSGSAGYAVFGRVVQGMDVVDAIRNLPVRDVPERGMQNVPVEPPVITTVRRVNQPR